MKVFGIALLAQCAFGFILPRQEAETKAFTDPATGIVFQTYTSKKNSKFGIALPKTGTKDLIGYLVWLHWRIGALIVLIGDTLVCSKRIHIWWRSVGIQDERHCKFLPRDMTLPYVFILNTSC